MPLVSVIVPCYNEQRTIRLLLEAVCKQTVSHQELEVIIADGLSSDQTRMEVSAFQQAHPELSIRLVDNVKRIIPAALNCAISSAQGKYIVRLDAHSIPAPDYIERCVENLKMDRGENVGGVWEIRSHGQGWMERAVAAAAAHPLGVGDARYRYGSTPGYVDTVPFGAFKREVFDRFGCFDETLLSNEDYEFNARLRQGGGRVWMDPRIRSVYFARPNLAALAKQYWRYGFWKYRMLRRYPQTVRWRQALPPLFVFGLLALALLALWWSAAGWLLVGVAALYLLALLAGSLMQAGKKYPPGLAPGVMLAIGVMHFSWGAGFLWSLASTAFRRQKL